MFKNTTKQYKAIRTQQVRLHATVEQEQRESIFRTAVAFEKFVLNYSNYHVSESTPQIYIVSSNLGEWTSHFVCSKLGHRKILNFIADLFFGLLSQSTVRKKVAAVHFTTILGEPNTANRAQKTATFLRNLSCTNNIVHAELRAF